jgi:hypothetical protein
MLCRCVLLLLLWLYVCLYKFLHKIKNYFVALYLRASGQDDDLGITDGEYGLACLLDSILQVTGILVSGGLSQYPRVYSLVASGLSMKRLKRTLALVAPAATVTLHSRHLAVSYKKWNLALYVYPDGEEEKDNFYSALRAAGNLQDSSSSSTSWFYPDLLIAVGCTDLGGLCLNGCPWYLLRDAELYAVASSDLSDARFLIDSLNFYSTTVQRCGK